MTAPDNELQVGQDIEREANDDRPVQVEAPVGEAASLARKAAFLGEDDGAGGERQESAWYVARLGGSPEGPFSQAALRFKAELGDLLLDDLVWSAGLPAWLPAQDIQGIWTVRADKLRLPPLPWEQRPNLRLRVGLLAKQRLSPTVLRLVGRVSAGMAGVIACVSLLLMFWKITWFGGALGLFLTFVVCEVAALGLEKVESLQAFLYHRYRDAQTANSAPPVTSGREDRNAVRP